VQTIKREFFFQPAEAHSSSFFSVYDAPFDIHDENQFNDVCARDCRICFLACWLILLLLRIASWISTNNENWNIFMIYQYHNAIFLMPHKKHFMAAYVCVCVCVYVGISVCNLVQLLRKAFMSACFSMQALKTLKCNLEWHEIHSQLKHVT